MSSSEHEPESRHGDFRIQRWDSGSLEEREDLLAMEEPLEIRVEGHPVAVVMRTPGHDEDLAAGFLLSEGVVNSPADIFEISRCPSQQGEETPGNVVDVLLRDQSVFDPASLTRHVFTSSSCGICGRATLDAVFQSFAPVEANWTLPVESLTAFPDRLREAQTTFALTGGLHATGLFDREGGLVELREDVGRHNAVDKIIGWALRHGDLPLQDHALMLSGRVSFELMQKALAAGIPLVAAISAPSSLAVEFARESNQTLVGFLRGENFNLYAGGQRIG